MHFNFNTPVFHHMLIKLNPLFFIKLIIYILKFIFPLIPFIRYESVNYFPILNSIQLSHFRTIQFIVLII